MKTPLALVICLIILQVSFPGNAQPRPLNYFSQDAPRDLIRGPRPDLPMQTINNQYTFQLSLQQRPNIPGSRYSRVEYVQVRIWGGDVPPLNAQGKLADAEMRRLRISAATRRMIDQIGRRGDQAGHIVADRWGGTTDLWNFYPQNGAFNGGQWRVIEGMIHAYLYNTRRTLTIQYSFHYPANNPMRPDGFWFSTNPPVPGVNNGYYTNPLRYGHV